MKVLVTGSTGFLGKKACAIFEKQGHAVIRTATSSRPGFAKMDVTQGRECQSVLSQERPGWVVNCAGAADVDWCEDNKEEAFEVNATGAGNVAEACAYARCRMLHVSTDYVFDGKKRSRYKEGDLTCPISEYGKSKLEGEKRVTESGVEFLIARVAALYGFNDANDKPTFATKVLSNLMQKKPFVAIMDQWNTPTFIDDAGVAFCRLMEQNAEGVINVAGSESLSRFEFATKVAESFGFDKNLIKTTLLEKVGFRAQRPAYSSLDISLLQGRGIAMSSATEGLKKMKNQIDGAGMLRKRGEETK